MQIMAIFYSIIHIQYGAYDRLWITLKKKNISQYALIKDYEIDKAQLQRLRKNMVVKTVILNRLCSILDCKIEDIMEFVPDEDIK